MTENRFNWDALMTIDECHRNIVNLNHTCMDLVCFYDNLKQDVQKKENFNYEKWVKEKTHYINMIDNAISKLSECKRLMNEINWNSNNN